MSTQGNQIPVSKLAYVEGVAETLGNLKLASWNSGAAYEVTIQKIASRLVPDPAEGPIELKVAADVCDAIIKLAKEMCDEEPSKEDKDKSRKEYMDGMDKEKADESEKKAALDYFTLCDMAAEGARKFAGVLKAAQETPSGQSQQGMNPGQGNMTGNRLTDAEAHDSLAQIENRRRPQGYAENVPKDNDLGAQIGEQSRHPGADNLGRASSSGGFQPARAGSKSASDILQDLFGVKAAQDVPTGQSEQGMNPGQSNMTGNALSDAEAHDSLSQIENRRRPSGYAENVPNDNELGAQIGSQSSHPGAGDVGRTNDAPGSGFQPAGKQGMDLNNDPDIEKLPKALQTKAYQKKMQSPSAQAKKALFTETAEQMSQHPVFNKLAKEQKVAYCKQLMYLDSSEKIAFFNELDKRLS